MPQVLFPSVSLTTSHTDDSFAQFAQFAHSTSSQCTTPEITDLVGHIRAWREHKTFKAQPMPVELKSSIAKLLTSGLYSKAALGLKF